MLGALALWALSATWLLPSVGHVASSGPRVARLDDKHRCILHAGRHEIFDYQWLPDGRALVLSGNRKSVAAYWYPELPSPKRSPAKLPQSTLATDDYGRWCVAPDGRSMLYIAVRSTQTEGIYGVNWEGVEFATGTVFVQPHLYGFGNDGGHSWGWLPGGSTWFALSKARERWVVLLYDRLDPNSIKQLDLSPPPFLGSLDYTRSYDAYTIDATTLLLVVRPSEIEVSPEGSRVEVSEIAIAEPSTAHGVHVVDLPGGRGYDTCALSPDKATVAWLLYRWLPVRGSRPGGPPPVTSGHADDAREYSIWLSRRDATGFVELARSTPRTIAQELSIGRLLWKPNGRAVTFLYGGSLWECPVGRARVAGVRH